LNWDIGIAFAFLILLISGIFLMRDITVWKWSLKHRIHLRNGISNSMKYKNWRAFMEKRKKGSPLEAFVRWIKTCRERKMDREIFESITFMRNLASIEKGKNSSSDFIIEQLAEHNGLLKPIFIRMLNLLRINQPKEAAALFSLKVGTPAARDFASLLIHWDRMEPNELLETLLSYEKSMKAVRLTEQKRKDEILSDLIYFPVVVHILVIFINFIYVAYFIDQKEMLRMFM
jgi:hypothetical protein